ncbi:unnamed protein product [Tilletia controversa]|nr:unnamed protein product [Tilletia controversa]
MGRQRNPSPLVAASRKGKGRAAVVGLGRASSAGPDEFTASTGRGRIASSSAASLKDLDISGHAGNINLGNTCFLNSVLQAVAVTVPLQELLEHQWTVARQGRDATRNKQAPASEWTDHDSEDGDDGSAEGIQASIERRRRRAAAKGKAKAHDSDVIMPEMPIGTREAPLSDAFRTHLSRAWSHRPGTAAPVNSSSSSRNKNAANAHALNPKPLLNALTRKFDQYGDFAQQDAHELLRHLLDACRMEEVDLIKKLKAERDAAEEADDEAPSLTHAAVRSLPAHAQEIAGMADKEPSSQDSARPRRSPRLVKPSPIPAHLGTDERGREESGSDASDSNPAHGGTLHILSGSGELTPMPNSRTAAGPFGPAFFPAPDTETPPSVQNVDHRPQKKAKMDFRPLIDVVFGGQLASIIVCESCRNVRHTYEDFYDISLPLRDESGHKVSDKSRKQKDRIRSMSELWRRAPASSVASSSANDARAQIAKSQLAHDEADQTLVLGKRRGSVAAMSETEVSETDATPGLMERRRQKAEVKRRASISSTKEKISTAAGAESSAGEDKARNLGGGGKSIFRTGSIRRSLGQLSRSSKESVISANIGDAAPGSPNNPADLNVVEGLERAVASMALSPSAQTAVLPTDSDIPYVALPPQNQQPSSSPAIFSFWRSARSSSKSPAPSSTSAGFSLMDSPDLRSRSTSPGRGHQATNSRDAVTRPASAVLDHAHLAPPPANAHAIPMVQKDGHATVTDHSGSSIQVSHAAPVGSVPATTESTPQSCTTPSASPMASLLLRTKAPPSSGFTPSSSNQTSPAVMATRFVSGTKLQQSGRSSRHAHAPRRGPSRQAQYLAKILADVAALEEAKETVGIGAPLSAVEESSVDGSSYDAIQHAPTRTRSPSAATALLQKMNGHSGNGVAVGANAKERSNGAASALPPASEIIAAEFETGLGQALCQFTKVELLEGDNAFKCRRCWRIAHPRTTQERQRRREKERQRKAREARKAMAGNKAEEEKEEEEFDDEDEDEDRRDSSETPSSDLETSDEDVDAILELPPALNRPALTRSNLQMNANKLAALSPNSSRRSSADSEALEVMGASILSAPGKLGEGAASQGPVQRSNSALERLPTIPSIRMSVPTASNAGDGPEAEGTVAEQVGDRPIATRTAATLSVSGTDNAHHTTLVHSPSNQGSVETTASMQDVGPSRGSNGSSKRSVNASSASISPRESLESMRPLDARRRSDEDIDEEPTARPTKTTFDAQDKGKKAGNGPSSVLATPASGKAGTGPRDKKAASAKAAKKATEAIERRALKRYLIASAPPVLVFHFKRFQSNTARFGGRRSRPGDFSKIDDPVSFPELFDVSPWLAPPREEFNRLGALKVTSDPTVLAQVQEEQGQLFNGSYAPHSPVHQATGPKPPRSPFRFLRTQQHADSPSTPKQEWYTSAANQKEAPSRPGSLYALYAVVNHQGNMSGGHYTAYVLSDRVRSKASKAQSRKAEVAKSSPLRSHSRHVSATGSHNQLGTSITDPTDGNVQSGTDTAVIDGVGVGDRTLEAKEREPTDRGDRHETDNRQWLHVSDATVRPVTASEVLSSKYVYMLFYERL